MDRIVVALGANLGTPKTQVREGIAAVRRLALRHGGHGWQASSLWASRPVDCPVDAPDFVNAVVTWLPPSSGPRPSAAGRRAAQWGGLPGNAVLTPESLLAALLALETRFGARSGIRNAPRYLDLDLLAFGNTMRATDTLTLPHPRAHQRAFVMAPLAEVAGAAIWPGMRDDRSASVAALADGLLRQAPGALWRIARR